MKFKSIIFDMDGTLIDSLIIWDVVWSKLGEKFLGNPDFKPDPEHDKAGRTMTLKDSMEYIHNLYNIGSSGTEVLDFVNQLSYDFYKNDVLLKDGVEEFLKQCLTDGTKMCIASATDITLIKVAMEHCGLNKYISTIFSCADIGKGKDQPDIYLKAMEYLGTSPDETWVFEDSAQAVLTAKKIGVNTVGIYDKNNYDQDVIKENATIYIGKDDTLMKLM